MEGGRRRAIGRRRLSVALIGLSLPSEFLLSSHDGIVFVFVGRCVSQGWTFAFLLFIINVCAVQILLVR